MKVLLVIVVLLVLILLLLIGLAKYSQKQSPMMFTANEVLACGNKPNCVCSENVESSSQAIEPITARGDENLLEALAEAVKTTGGQILSKTDDELRATYKTPIFGFVDDVVFRIEGTKNVAQVLSVSRVGYGDLGANRKRVEKIRAALN